MNSPIKTNLEILETRDQKILKRFKVIFKNFLPVSGRPQLEIN